MRLETERLILRNLREDDLADFHAHHSDPEICRFLRHDLFTPEMTREFIGRQKDAEFGMPGEWVQVGVELKEMGRLIGDLALKPEKEEPRVVEFGVTLGPGHRQRGYAIEALRAVFGHLFKDTDTHRIVGLLDTENDASRRLMENLGFRREGEFRKSFWDRRMDAWRDEYLYALLREDWK